MRILKSEKKSQQLSKHTTRELLLCEIFKKTHRLLSLSHVFFFLITNFINKPHPWYKKYQKGGTSDTNMGKLQVVKNQTRASQQNSQKGSNRTRKSAEQ
jgi:hypothetical protein